MLDHVVPGDLRETAETPTGSSPQVDQARQAPSFLVRNRARFDALFVCYWIVIFVGTHVPRVPQGIEGFSDKYLHFVAYAGLSGLLALAASSRGRLSALRYAQLFVAVALYGALDEILQIPVGRDCSLWDWCADIAGSVIGFTCFAAAWVLFPRTRPADRPQ